MYDKFELNERYGYFIWNNELSKWYIKRNEIPTSFAVIYIYIRMRSINEEQKDKARFKLKFTWFFKFQDLDVINQEGEGRRKMQRESIFTCKFKYKIL